jgi:hypothetical protein
MGPALGVTVLAALALAGCSQALPVGPAPAPRPTPTRLASAIVMLPGVTDPAATAGHCPAGEVELSGPGIQPASVGPASSPVNPPPVCFRKQGQPLTVTTAGVAVVEQSNSRPAGPPTGTQPAASASWVVNVNLPGADAAALASLTSKLAGTQVQLAIIVDGQTWGMPLTLQPLTDGEFVIATKGKSQALQLQRLLTR